MYMKINRLNKIHNSSKTDLTLFAVKIHIFCIIYFLAFAINTLTAVTRPGSPEVFLSAHTMFTN